MLVRLAHSIFFGAWLIDESFVMGNLNIIDKLLQGEPVKDLLSDFKRPETNIQLSSNRYISIANISSRAFERDSVAILSIHNPITKHDMECGPAGTMSMDRWVKNALADPNVLAIVLDIDSPGGEASYIESFASTIKNADKPILTYTTGLCASAAYWLASAGQEIYAQESSDMIGSVGAMSTFLDIIPALEKQGIKYHEVYAKQSGRKGEMFQKAREGDYSILQEKILNPMAQGFIDGVKSNRPDISTDSTVYEGDVFQAHEALSLNMIDGFKSFEEVVQRAYELGLEHKENTKKQNSTTMSFTKLYAALGVATLVVDKEKGSYLQESQLQAIEDELVAGSQAIADHAKLTDEKTALDTKVADLTQQLSAMQTERDALKAENEKLGGQASGGKPIEGQQTFEEDEDIDIDSPNHPTNLALASKYNFNPIKK